MSRNDGGPAFPLPMITCDNQGGYTDVRYGGMTLRDYFASFAPNMDVTDICDMMGWEKDIPVGDPDEHGSEDEGSGWRDSVFARWHDLPLKTRLQAQTKYSYMFADAMLASRQE